MSQCIRAAEYEAQAAYGGVAPRVKHKRRAAGLTRHRSLRVTQRDWLVPGYDGVLFAHFPSREALWDRSDMAAVRTEAGRLCLVVAIDRTGTFNARTKNQSVLPPIQAITP
jgi:hypothetical protein